MLAFQLMAARKTGYSGRQVNRTVGVTYKTAWFMEYRIRATMTYNEADPIGRQGKVVEADQMYHGTKEIRAVDPKHGTWPLAKGGRSGVGETRAIIALVARGGRPGPCP
jgi:hypothetical protein